MNKWMIHLKVLQAEKTPNLPRSLCVRVVLLCVCVCVGIFMCMYACMPMSITLGLFVSV